jgi:hypothetical protein
MSNLQVLVEVDSWMPDPENDYVVLTVKVGVATATEWLEKSSDVETVASKLEWMAQKLRASSKHAR